jgi:hypothetical protein
MQKLTARNLQTLGRLSHPLARPWVSTLASVKLVRQVHSRNVPDAQFSKFEEGYNKGEENMTSLQIKKTNLLVADLNDDFGLMAIKNPKKILELFTTHPKKKELSFEHLLQIFERYTTLSHSCNTTAREIGLDSISHGHIERERYSVLKAQLKGALKKLKGHELYMTFDFAEVQGLDTAEAKEIKLQELADS